MKNIVKLPYEGSLFFNIKLLLGLPFPLKNHFYKLRRISFDKNWFCKSCHHIFDITLNNHDRLSDFKCPKCQSRSIYYSNGVFKAIVDKKPVSEIFKVIEFEKRYDKKKV